MSANALHAMLTLLVGLSVGALWLRLFWRKQPAVTSAPLLAPAAAGFLGLGHWVAYDFSLQHWAGDFSLAQALFNFAVTLVLLARRNRGGAAQRHA
ncbi:MAG: hypothetical protein ACT4R6_04945 [Gemmatimonadaceae bacterium]